MLKKISPTGASFVFLTNDDFVKNETLIISGRGIKAVKAAEAAKIVEIVKVKGSKASKKSFSDDIIILL